MFSAAGGEVNEKKFVVGEFVELVESVTVEEGSENREKVEVFAFVIDADGKGEPAAGRGAQVGEEVGVVEGADVMAEIFVDVDGPACGFEFGEGGGAKPRPVNGGRELVRFGKPGGGGIEFGVGFFFEGEKKTVGGI